MVVVAGATGMRFAELLGTTWNAKRIPVAPATTTIIGDA
jgi:hypothetical protein